MPIFGIFPTGGGVKSDEDDHGSGSAVRDLLTPLEEEERKKEPFDSVEWNPISALHHKKIVVEEKTGKSSLAPSL